MYGHHIITHSKTKDQPGKAIPARFQLNRENEYISLSPSAPENLVSQDGYGSPVPRQPAHLRTRAQSGAYLRDSSRVPRRRLFIHLNRHTPSDQSQVHQVTQLRTDGVHCRETTGTGPVNFKVVQVTGTAFASPDQFICASLSRAQCWHEVGISNRLLQISPRYRSREFRRGTPTKGRNTTLHGYQAGLFLLCGSA